MGTGWEGGEIWDHGLEWGGEKGLSPPGPGPWSGTPFSWYPPPPPRWWVPLQGSSAFCLAGHQASLRRVHHQLVFELSKKQAPQRIYVSILGDLVMHLLH